MFYGTTSGLPQVILWGARFAALANRGRLTLSPPCTASRSAASWKRAESLRAKPEGQALCWLPLHNRRAARSPRGTRPPCMGNARRTAETRRTPAPVLLPNARAPLRWRLSFVRFGHPPRRHREIQTSVVRTAVLPLSDGPDSGAPGSRGFDCVQRPHNLSINAELLMGSFQRRPVRRLRSSLSVR